MVTLELIGFQNFKRINFKSIKEARKAFPGLRNETYQAYSSGSMTTQKWSTWELYQSGQLVKEGKF